MSVKRVPFATKIQYQLKEYLQELSQITRIPQSKLTDEAISDLLKKYKFNELIKNDNIPSIHPWMQDFLGEEK